MSSNRIERHPVLPIESREILTFSWEGKKLEARRGETIAAALFANGIRIFGHHPKDGAPMGIRCANGQCAQCLVVADDKPLKACMELVTPGMRVEPMDGVSQLPLVDRAPEVGEVDEVTVEVLIIGGGPAGLSAAVQLAEFGIETLLVDDKHRLGGKMVLQTHRSFGSVEAVHAGTRGVDIATRLAAEVRRCDRVRVWLHSTVLAVFRDRRVGVLHERGKRYSLVKPRVLLVATGARERYLAFKGNTLPGVYGAGAFQTLVNRDLVLPAEKLFIVGGGNVGLIAGYHALQAGIAVAGVVEVMPECLGYKVHRDKLARLGVPIHTSHTILSANGEKMVDSVTIARVDDHFRPIPYTERSFACDTVLVAVGLDPVNQFYLKAREFGMAVFAAGDAEEIAEASSAMYSGRMRALEIARSLGHAGAEIPGEWFHTMEILKTRTGEVHQRPTPQFETGVRPVFHCSQEIPCDPCAAVCPQKAIHIDQTDIRHLPDYLGDDLDVSCLGCEKCVSFCPGLAITLVDYRSDPKFPTVSIPFEFPADDIRAGDTVRVLDAEGESLGNVEVTSVQFPPPSNGTLVVRVRSPESIAKRIAGIRVQKEDVTRPLEKPILRLKDDTVVCHCERVTVAEIRELIRQGFRDINAIKAVARAGMGACGAKDCIPLIQQIFREEGVAAEEVGDHVRRPLFMEVPLGLFAGIAEKENDGSAEKNRPHFDVIVIGAGSVGVPAAMAFAGAGLRTLVLDRGASVGQGSTRPPSAASGPRIPIRPKSASVFAASAYSPPGRRTLEIISTGAKEAMLLSPTGKKRKKSSKNC